MARVKYTGSTSTVQLQPAQVRNKTQTESEEVSRLKLEESLVLQQQQSLEMVQIMLHVSVSSSLFWSLWWLPDTNPCCLTISLEHYFIFGLPTPVTIRNASASLIYIFKGVFAAWVLRRSWPKASSTRAEILIRRFHPWKDTPWDSREQSRACFWQREERSAPEGHYS